MFIPFRSTPSGPLSSALFRGTLAGPAPWADGVQQHLLRRLHSAELGRRPRLWELAYIPWGCCCIALHALLLQSYKAPSLCVHTALPLSQCVPLLPIHRCAPLELCSLPPKRRPWLTTWL